MTYGLINYRAIHEPTTRDFATLRAIARQLVGERLLFARRGYPDVLKLHFGNSDSSPGVRGRTLPRGSYVLSSVASAWSFKISRLGATIESDGASGSLAPVGVGSPLSHERLDELLASAGGSVVQSIEVESTAFGYSLQAVLSDGSVFRVLPTVDGECPAEELPIPDWELFTPHQRVLRVGPGPKWSYLPSDRPEAVESTAVVAQPC